MHTVELLDSVQPYVQPSCVMQMCIPRNKTFILFYGNCEEKSDKSLHFDPALLHHRTPNSFHTCKMKYICDPLNPVEVAF
jgi:hypothetical protein